jgi:hypothetical protein
MRKMCTLITSKGTNMDENIANQNHATRTRTPKPGYLKLPIGFYSPISLPLDHLLVVGSLPQLIHLNLFSLACAINNRHISSHKMTSVPQRYITHAVVFTTRPLACCRKLIATVFTLFFSISSLCN